VSREGKAGEQFSVAFAKRFHPFPLPNKEVMLHKLRQRMGLENSSEELAFARMGLSGLFFS